MFLSTSMLIEGGKVIEGGEEEGEGTAGRAAGEFAALIPKRKPLTFCLLQLTLE